MLEMLKKTAYILSDFMYIGAGVAIAIWGGRELFKDNGWIEVD